MTVLQLLGIITAAILLQIAAGGIALWRRRRIVGGSEAPTDRNTQPVSALAWPGWREFRVTRREFEDPARTQCSFYLEPADGAPLPEFKPGQFLTFQLQANPGGPGTTGDAVTVTRCYSLSDQPRPAAYRVTIKRVSAPPDLPELPAGISSNHFHDRVQVGDRLMLKAPSGKFFIDPDPQQPAVLIAGGIGITPMLSMLLWCLAEQPGRTVHLYYGLKNSREHGYKQTLEQLAGSHSNFHLHVVYSKPGTDDVAERDFHHAGHVDVDLLRRTLPHGQHQFYVCGPAAMMESLIPALAQWGVARHDIHFEAFGPASVRLASAAPKDAGAAIATPLEVRFRRSGRTLQWDGRDASLLDFAERHALTVDSGCRSGGCGSCETRLVSGTVRYSHTPDHEVAAGHCLLCVGLPDSPLVLEA